MKLYLKFDSSLAFKKIIQEQLEKLNMNFTQTGMNELEVGDSLSGDALRQISSVLNEYGIEIIETQKSVLVQRIKDTIFEMVNREEKLPTSNSNYLAEKLKQRYTYLSAVFSEVTYTSIENYILLQKAERAKQLISTNEYTFTEIAYMLNYSSVAYFSNQFKSITGITPSAFQRIINKKRENKAITIS
ncbi:MAG: helix-turn-helix transcriptional regulator [Bacteroidales bacterium]|nr:helix-turn-helix transcriptional regulator [Bacteroidales bacterium]